MASFEAAVPAVAYSRNQEPRCLTSILRTPCLPQTGLHRRCALPLPSVWRRQRRAGWLVPKAQLPHEATPLHRYNTSPSTLSQQAVGIYYDSNPPQAPPNAYQYKQAAATGSTPNSSTQQPPQNSLPQQNGAYVVQASTGPGDNPEALKSINPGKNHINSVRLMGTVVRPGRQGRCTYANIEVPYATKDGCQEFQLEAWDAAATHLVGLHGRQVLVDGRLARDAASGGIKVVVSRVQLVDQSLPGTSYHGSQAGGSRSFSESRTPAAILDPQQVWRQHYTSPTRTVKALASHFGVQPSTVVKALFLHAFQSKSPLHWRVLAEEAKLGPADDPHLGDFMVLVSRYKESLAAMYGGAKLGATLPPPPITSDGLLKVKPIREWALAMPYEDSARETLEQYEAKLGLSMLYEALRMAVVAEATQGVWNFDAEFGAE